MYVQLVPSVQLASAQKNKKLTSEMSTLGLTQVITRSAVNKVRYYSVEEPSKPRKRAAEVEVKEHKTAPTQPEKKKKPTKEGKQSSQINFDNNNILF